MTKNALLLAGLLIALPAQAELMTVKHLKDLLGAGKAGEAAAVSYVQGVTDGMLGMELLHKKERGTPPEFCKLHEASAKGQPMQHPAYQTKNIVRAWERSKQPMDTLVVNMIVMYLSAKYGCSQ
jgi:hypothetical protein